MSRNLSTKREGYITVNAVVVYKHEGEEITFETQDMEEFLSKIDEIQYTLAPQGAELISVTNNGNPVPMVRGW